MGTPPTNVTSWTKYAKEKNVGKNNAVIMGRNCYEFMISDQGVFFIVKNYVISSHYEHDQHTQVVGIDTGRYLFR